jgi:hypothetical protein
MSRKEPLLKPSPKQSKLSLMHSRVPNLQMRPEATLSPGIDGDPGRNLTPLAAALCPMVGANCRGNLESVAMGRLIEGPQRW